MILFLYGADSYRRIKKTEELIKSYRQKNPAADLLVVDLEESPDDWTKARDFLNQPSLFADTRMVLVKESGAVEKAADAKVGASWLKFLKSVIETPKSFILISDSGAPKKAFKFLLEAQTQEFPELSGATLEAFLKKEAATRELKFSPMAWKLLCDFITEQSEGRSWRAVAELEKISFAGFAQPISVSDLETLIQKSSKENVFFAMKQFLQSMPLARKIGALEKLFLQKEAGAYLFNSLAYQAFGDSAKRLADYDISIKSGGLDYEEALLDFVLA